MKYSRYEYTRTNTRTYWNKEEEEEEEEEEGISGVRVGGARSSDEERMSGSYFNPWLSFEVPPLRSPRERESSLGFF